MLGFITKRRVILSISARGNFISVFICIYINKSYKSNDLSFKPYIPLISEASPNCAEV